MIAQGKKAIADNESMRFQRVKAIKRQKREKEAAAAAAGEESLRHLYNTSNEAAQNAAQLFTEQIKKKTAAEERLECRARIRLEVYANYDGIAKACKQQIKAEVRAELEEELEPLIRAELALKFEAEIKQQLEDELLSDLEADIRAEHEESLILHLKEELRAELKPLIEEELRNGSAHSESSRPDLQPDTQAHEGETGIQTNGQADKVSSLINGHVEEAHSQIQNILFEESSNAGEKSPPKSADPSQFGSLLASPHKDNEANKPSSSIDGDGNEESTLISEETIETWTKIEKHETSDRPFTLEDETLLASFQTHDGINTSFTAVNTQQPLYPDLSKHDNTISSPPHSHSSSHKRSRSRSRSIKEEGKEEDEDEEDAYNGFCYGQVAKKLKSEPTIVYSANPTAHEYDAYRSVSQGDYIGAVLAEEGLLSSKGNLTDIQGFMSEMEREDDKESMDERLDESQDEIQDESLDENEYDSNGELIEDDYDGEQQGYFENGYDSEGKSDSGLGEDEVESDKVANLRAQGASQTEAITLSDSEDEEAGDTTLVN